MSRVVSFTRQASAEFEEAIAWYEDQLAGLGMRFAGEVVAAAQHAAELPGIHGIIYKNFRSVRVRRFPYSVIFREEPVRIVVVAVFHARRHPGAWQRRT